MAVLKKLSARGDTTLATWDPAKIAEGDAETKAAVTEAERLIEDAKRRGDAVVRAYPGETGKPAERVGTFDPETMEEVLIIPRMVGGC